MRRLANQRNEARARLMAVLDSERYVGLLDRLAQAAADPPLAAPAAQVERLEETVTAEVLVPMAAGGPPAPDEFVEGPTSPGLSSNALPSHELPSDRLPSDRLPPDRLPSDGLLSNGAPPDAVSSPRPACDQEARAVLARLVRRPWRHLQQAVDALGDQPADEDLHEVRIRAKRLRYAAEAAAPVMGRPARRLASAVADVQGALGDMHDAVVAEEWLRQAAKSAPASTALVAGELIALERGEQQVGRDTWAKPWKQASDKRLRAWLKR
jgi:CHAD domain-containing protein